MFVGISAANAETVQVRYTCTNGSPSGTIIRNETLVTTDCNSARNGSESTTVSACKMFTVQTANTVGCTPPAGSGGDAYELAGWRVGNSLWLFKPGDMYAVDGVYNGQSIIGAGYSSLGDIVLNAVWTKVGKTFEITTTSSTTTFTIKIAAKGKWKIDWGDGTVESINQTTNEQTSYNHSYSSAGSYKIGMYMTNVYNGASYKEKFVFSRESPVVEFVPKSKIAAIDGCLGCLFNSAWKIRHDVWSSTGAKLYHNTPSYQKLFQGASNLHGSIPSNLFVGSPSHKQPYKNNWNWFNPFAWGVVGEGIGFLYGIDLLSTSGFMFTALEASLAANLGLIAAVFAVGSFIAMTVTEYDSFPKLAPVTVLPKYSFSFDGCVNLTGSIPPYLFGTFADVANTVSLTSEGSAFEGTFRSCRGLSGTIPGTLFGNDSSIADENVGMGYLPPQYTFANTFENCSGLSGPLPSGLFRLAKGYATGMFVRTFKGCSNIDGAIPGNLFLNLGASSNASDFADNADYMFYGTFYGCSKLGTNAGGLNFVPPALFGTKSVRWGGKSADAFMGHIFDGANGMRITTCPAGYTEYATGFKTDYWWNYSSTNPGYVVSCTPSNSPVYTMTLNNNGGWWGTGYVYEKYESGWALSQDSTTWDPYVNVSIPNPSQGSDDLFRGYYYRTGGGAIPDAEFSVSGPTGVTIPNDAVQRIDKNGKTLANSYISGSQTWYAAWVKRCENVSISNGSCSTSVSNDGNVEYTLSCNPGYEQSGWQCTPKIVGIDLRNDNDGSSHPGTDYLYAIYGDAVYNIDGDLLLPNDNPIDIPVKTVEVHYDLNDDDTGTAFINLSDIHRFADLEYQGYYQNSSSNTPYIGRAGYITDEGIAAGISYTTSHTWEAHWGPGSVLLPTATRPGYRFGGWYTDDTLTTLAGTTGQQYSVSSGNIRLFAKWTRQVYTITMEHNGATNAASLLDTVYLVRDVDFYLNYSGSGTNPTNKIEQLSKIPSKSGYTFLGYYYDTANPTGWTRGGNVQHGQWIRVVDPDGTFINTGFTSSDATITAMFGESIYQISLDHNGGFNTVDEVWLKYDDGFYSEFNGTSLVTRISSVNVPTRAGFTFNGYYYTTKSSGTGGSGGGGNTKGGENSQVEIVTVVYPPQGNATVGDLTTDYTFTSSPVTAVAEWIPNIYPVTFNKNGGNGGINSAYLQYDDGLYTTNNAGTVSGAVAPSQLQPTRRGYLFDGYYYTPGARDGGSGNQAVIRVINSNGVLLNPRFTTNENGTELVAQWIPEIYTITLEDNGGDGGDPNTVYMQYAVNWFRNSDGTNSIAQLDETPIRHGYRFTGYWKVADNYSGSLTGGCTACLSNTKVIDEDGYLLETALDFTRTNATIVAGWTPRIIQITLDDNDGSGGAPSSFYLKYGDGWYSDSSASQQLEKITSVPSLQGYDFVGYYDTLEFNSRSGGSGQSQSAVQIVYEDRTLNPRTEAVTFTAGDTDIYAAWSPKCNEVTLNPNGGTAGTVTKLYKKTGVAGFYLDNACETEWQGENLDVGPQKQGYTFRGFYQTQQNNVEQNSVLSVYPWIAFDRTETLYGRYGLVDDDITLYAAWARNCADSNVCELVITTDGDVTYTASCSEGYSASNSGAYNVTCSPNCNVITLDDHSRGGSADRTLYKLTGNTGWYDDNQCSHAISQISAPTKTNATFTEYIYTYGVEDLQVGSGAPDVTLNSWRVTQNETIVAHYDCDSNYDDGGVDIVGACNSNIYDITLSLNGTGATGGNGHVYEVYGDHWSLNSNGTGSVNALTLPARSDYAFRGYFSTAVADISSTGNTANQIFGMDLALPSGATIFDSDDTIYAGWARDCVSNPTNATCQRSFTNNGADVTYTTACTGEVNGVQHGYTPDSGTAGTYNPSCSANEINLNWDENNNNGTPITNGQCVYDGNLVLPAAPSYPGYNFMYWKLASGSSNPYQAAGTTISGGCVYDNTGVYSGTSTDIQAVWCPVCVPGSHATCVSFSYDTSTTPGTCTYVTGCDEGYDADTGTANTAAPSCHEHTYNITYKPGTGASGTNVQQPVDYMDEFTTHGYSQTQFTKANSVLKAWQKTSTGGGNYTLLNHTYDHYNVTSDTELTAVWGTCTCDSTHASVQSCVAANNSVQNNQCQFDVTCASGYDQNTASYTCDTTNPEQCTAMCIAGHTITLSGGTTPGTTTIYTTENTAVYRNAARTEVMTANDYPITLPQRAYTVTYNTHDGTLASGATSPVTATYTFEGYYDSANGSNQYIADNGFITEPNGGIAAGISYTTDATWYAQWSGGSVTLPNVTRAGYVFDGWYADSTYETPANENNGAAGTSYSPLDNITLHAKWVECTAGNYCPGDNTVVSCSTATNSIYTNSAAGSDEVTDCYVTCAKGTGVLNINEACSTLTGSRYQIGNHNVYYGSVTPTNSDTDNPVAGVIYSCPSNYTISGTGTAYHDQRRDCKRTITLNKNGGVASGECSVANSVPCRAGENCELPDATCLTLVGYSFSGTWKTSGGDCVRIVNTPSVGTYYACKSADSITCEAGKYLEADDAKCHACPAGKYCEGGTWTYDGTDKGIDGDVGAGYYAVSGCKVQNPSTSADYITGGDCGTIAAGRYGAAGATSDQGTGDVSAGYFSTGGGTSATPTGTGNGCVTGKTCGTIAAGYYGGAGATSSTGSGMVSGGYYSTGGGTSATPTGTGNGCITGNTCGKLSAEYYSSGGSTIDGSICISGQDCGTCDVNYRDNETTGKTLETQCQADCSAGTRVASARAACSTPGGSWYTSAHTVSYGSTSGDNVKSCVTNYSTPTTTTATDHDAQSDCVRTITLNKNGGSGTLTGTDVIDNGGTNAASIICHEGVSCALPVTDGVLVKTGYTFNDGWGTSASASGNNCVSAVSTPTVGTYYACQTADIYTITLRNYNDTATDSTIYEKYNTGWYSNSGANMGLSAASIPSRNDYTFRGYYTAKQSDLTASGGSGTRRITNASNDNLPPSTTFSADTNLYAAWARDCAPGAGCNCDLTIDNDGKAVYTTSAQTGYTLINGNATYAPVCDANTYNITYAINGGTPAYTQLEYLKADSSAYIDTGFVPSGNYTHKLAFGISSNPSSNAYICGTGTSNGRSGNVRIGTSGQINGIYIGTSGAVSILSGAQTLVNGENALIMNLKNNAVSEVYLNGTKISNTNVSTITSTDTLKLFGSGSNYSRGVTKIYSSTITQNGTVIHNFVPARKNSDSVLGMYDTVTGDFKTNAASSGAFTGGTDVGPVPSKYIYGVGATVAAGDPTRLHSSFDGWCDDAELSVNCAKSRMVSKTDTGNKMFYAKWVCDTGYHANNDGTACVANTYTITVAAGHGVSTVSGTGWTGTETGTMTKSYEYGTEIDLADIVTLLHKDGYKGVSYTKSGGGTLDGSVFTVGDAVATITVSATEIDAPTANITNSDTTLTYNQSNTTLTATDMSSLYDNGVSIQYKFLGSSDNSTYTNVSDWASSRTYTVNKTDHHGKKYYKVQVRVSDGVLAAQIDTSTAKYVDLTQRAITFNATSCGALDGTSPLYARYNSTSLYTSATSDTTGSVPGAGQSNASFAGWYTSAGGGSQVYNATRVLQSSVSGHTNSSGQWIATENKTLYAHYNCDSGYHADSTAGCCVANTNTITLNANGATGGKIKNTAISSGSQTVTFTCDTDSSISLPTWSSTDSATTTSIVLANKVFKGWSESADGSVVSVTTCPTANKTYYAVWEGCECGTDVNATCSISVENNVCNYIHTCNLGYYHADNGSSIASNSIECTQCPAGSYCGSGATTPVLCPTNWTSDAGASAATECYRGITLNKNSSITGTLTSANAVNIVTDSGSTNAATVKCYYNTACEFPATTSISTRAGYAVSGGWATSATGMNSTTTSFTITSENSTVTYYASRSGVRLTLNKGDGTGGSSYIYTKYNTKVFTNSDRTIEMSTDANNVTPPSKEGYTFSGYYNSATGTTKYIDADGYITNAGLTYAKNRTANATLYAQYTPNIVASASDKTLTYNGDPQSCANVTVTTPETGATITYSTTSNGGYINTEPTLTNVGSTTVYYRVEATGYVAATGSYTCTMNKADCTVTLSQTSGSVTYPTLSTTFTASTNSGGTLVVESETPSVATAAINNNGTVTLTPLASGSSTITVTSAATSNYNSCYATYTFTVNDKTININSNGGNGTCAGGSITCTYASNTCVAPTWNSSTCNITKVNSELIKWNTESDASGTNIAFGGDASNISGTLYAVWSACSSCSTASATTNTANCSLSGVVNNVCTYDTSCKCGHYNITNNGKYNPTCTAVGNGYYSANGDNTRSACSVTAGASYTQSDGTRCSINDCYIPNCVKACSGNAACFSNATCTYNTGYTTNDGTQYYGGSCTSTASTCPVSGWSCDDGYYHTNNGCTACTTVANTTSTQNGTESCDIAHGTGSRSYTETCSGYCTGGAGGTSGSSACTGCSNWTRTSTGTCYVVTCDAGYYMYNNACVPVSAGYYSAQDETERHQCPNSLVTRGYGLAADEIGDCGRILHVGSNQLFLRSNRQTSPSLNLKIDNTVFYADMYPVDGGVINGKFKTSYNDQTYVICDQTGDTCTIMGPGW